MRAGVEERPRCPACGRLASFPRLERAGGEQRLCADPFHAELAGLNMTGFGRGLYVVPPPAGTPDPGTPRLLSSRWLPVSRRVYRWLQHPLRETPQEILFALVWALMIVMLALH